MKLDCVCNQWKSLKLQLTSQTTIVIYFALGLKITICKLILLGLREKDRLDEVDLMPKLKMKNFLETSTK